MSDESQIVKDSLKDSGLWEIFEKVESRFQGQNIYLVGGAIRDAFIGKTIQDLDFACSFEPGRVLEVLKGEKLRTQGLEFGTVTWSLLGHEIEITTFRCDETYENHRQPENLRFGDSKLEDLERRDFTINSMMYSSLEGLYDPLGGLKDLKAKVLKAVGKPSKRFKEDALRILRMYRFNLNYGFEIEAETLKAANENFSLIKNLSKERVVSEFQKTFRKKVDVKCLNVILNAYCDLFISGNEKKVFSIYEQVHFLKCTKVDINLYLYEKKYKRIYELYTNLEEAGSLTDYQKIILSYVNKNQIDSFEAKKLWFNAKNYGVSHSKRIKEFNLTPLSKVMIEKLKALRSGKALGESILDEELKASFKLVDNF